MKRILRLVIVGLVLLLCQHSLVASEVITADVTDGIYAFQKRKIDLAITKFSGPAERGDSTAQYYLGSALLTKVGLWRIDGENVFKFFGTSLDVCTYPEIGKKAEEWLIKAAGGGYLDASLLLASLYKRGACGVMPSEALSQKWKQRAREILIKVTEVAESGDPKAQLKLGLVYFELNQTEDAVMWLSRAAERDEPHAMYRLATFYATGWGVKQDLHRTIELMHRVARINGPWSNEADSYLARAYAKGIYVKKDIPKALELYRRVLARKPLIRDRELDDLLSQDIAKGGSSSRLAGERGEAEELFRQALVYQRGHKGSRDLAKAVTLYMRASNLGHTQAQFRLGAILQSGQGVTRNEAEATKYYLMAAQNGHRDAQFNLAQMYEFGRGIDIDLLEAGRWYRLAANQGHPDAQKKIALLDRKYGKPELHAIYHIANPPQPSSMNECRAVEGQGIEKLSGVSSHSGSESHNIGSPIIRSKEGGAIIISSQHSLPPDLSGRADRQNNQREINWITTDVHIKRKNRPLILALGAYHSVHWNLKLDPEVTLSKLILGGFYPQKISGLPEGTKVLRKVYMETTDLPREYLDLSLSKYQHPHEKITNYERTVTKLRMLTGLEPTSAQSDGPIGPREISDTYVYPWYPKPSLAELHVIQVDGGFVNQRGSIVGCTPRGVINVAVYPTEKPMVLALISRQPVLWRINQMSGANLSRVLVNEIYPQVKGLGPGVPVAAIWEIDSTTSIGVPEPKILEQIQGVTGLSAKSTQKMHRGDNFAVPRPAITSTNH